MDYILCRRCRFKEVRSFSLGYCNVVAGDSAARQQRTCTMAVCRMDFEMEEEDE